MYVGFQLLRGLGWIVDDAPTDNDITVVKDNRLTRRNGSLWFVKGKGYAIITYWIDNGLGWMMAISYFGRAS